MILSWLNLMLWNSVQFSCVKLHLEKVTLPTISTIIVNMSWGARARSPPRSSTCISRKDSASRVLPLSKIHPSVCTDAAFGLWFVIVTSWGQNGHSTSEGTGRTDWLTGSMAFAAARMITEKEKARKTSQNRNDPTVSFNTDKSTYT